MQSQNKFFEDLSKIVNGAAGTVAGMAREAESSVRDRARDWVGGLDLVSREEFDAHKDMLAAARAEIAELKARIDALEGNAPAAAKRPRAPKKTEK